MENKIIWIVDNPYGDKFIATKTASGTQTVVTKEQALAMTKAPGVFVSAKADVNLRAVPCQEWSSDADGIVRHY